MRTAPFTQSLPDSSAPLQADGITINNPSEIVKTHPNKFRTLFFVIAILGTVPLAALFLFLGVVNLVNPQSPDSTVVEGVIVGMTLILIAVSSLFALFRPAIGGLLLCIGTVACALVFNAFHLSEMLLPGRTVGYHPFWTGVTILILVLGVVSLIRGRIRRRKATVGTVQFR